MKKCIIISLIILCLVGCAIPNMQEDIKVLQQRTEEQEKKLKEQEKKIKEQEEQNDLQKEKIKEQEEQNNSQKEKIQEYEETLSLIEEHLTELKEKQDKLLQNCEVTFGDKNEVYYWKNDKLLYFHSYSCIDFYEFIYEEDGSLESVRETFYPPEPIISQYIFDDNSKEYIKYEDELIKNHSSDVWDIINNDYKDFGEYLIKVWGNKEE